MKRLVQNKKSAAKLRQKKTAEYENVREKAVYWQQEIEKHQSQLKEKNALIDRQTVLMDQIRLKKQKLTDQRDKFVGT